MAYNILDIINKAQNIALKRKNIYKKLNEENCGIPSIKIISKVLIKELDKTIKYYDTLKEVIGNTELEEIDLEVYDKMSFLINEFNRKVYVPEIHNVKEYIHFILGLEKDLYSLMVDLQGRFIKNKNDLQTKTYRVLSHMIAAKSAQIEAIEKLLK